MSVAEAAPDARVLSRYGIVSSVLAVLCVAATVLGGLIWWQHHSEVAERTAQSNALQAAADWTGVLINMNLDNVDASMSKLHEGTVGELNADFEASIKPYRDVVQTLKSRATGRVDSVAIESVHHDLDVAPGAPAVPRPGLPPGMAERTDTVLVVASSVTQNAGGQPQTVRWHLRLDVSDIDGRPLISRLETLR